MRGNDGAAVVARNGGETWFSRVGDPPTIRRKTNRQQKSKPPTTLVKSERCWANYPVNPEKIIRKCNEQTI
jgi:hypothetical protein